MLRLLVMPAFLLTLALQGGPAEKERKLLQGKWTVVSIVSKAGKEEPQGRMTAQIAGDKLISKENDKVTGEATFTLDASKIPKFIDLKPSSGGDKGKSFLGIYELNGNDLKLCFGPVNGLRPMEFAANAGQSLILLKRIKE